MPNTSRDNNVVAKEAKMLMNFLDPFEHVGRRCAYNDEIGDFLPGASVCVRHR